ncbi:ERF family protein [Pullulanibacillus sp. KACC 23026]|uniref:ERF family protein n=1 Tax=Pullulanibacillus sp. KACC 23026 TaxID=3028315 RepID=UPI0023AF12AC|nr:ERF family protein [Pullulanibacillus sp. KACC 23026]WEG13977.1 ERF family protein [Pullulanibacillus sp. KACC 23026]
MNKSESIGALAKALSAFQAEVKQPTKDKSNPFFKSKYVPLENVVESITSIANNHGLSFIQYPLNQDNKVGVVTVLMHESGEYIESEPIFATPVKTDAQAAGSIITYLKRYSLSAMFGITSDEDDDGNSASQQKEEENIEF